MLMFELSNPFDGPFKISSVSPVRSTSGDSFDPFNAVFELGLVAEAGIAPYHISREETNN